MSLTDWMTGIQHVGIPTNDIEKTIAFYEALGFRNIYRTRNEAAGEAVCFLQMKNLCIETYQTGKAALKAGAVDHILRTLRKPIRPPGSWAVPSLKREFPSCPSGSGASAISSSWAQIRSKSNFARSFPFDP